MGKQPRIEGQCDAKFARVREVFLENFSTLGETGACLALTVDGRSVVDIWGGYTDSEHTQPWQRDSIANVFSTTKGLTAICAHRLADQGKLDLDAPVARYWPEFAQAGKDNLPVRYLLSHQAGLPAVSEFLPTEALYDWERMTSALAAQKPWWEPGTKHGYHALTYGWLVGEVIRRVSGKSVGTYFKEEVAGPLGLDAHIGLAAELDARVAPLMPPQLPDLSQMEMMSQVLADPEGVRAKTLLNPVLPPDVANRREWRAAEIPAANGHTNARALAKLYGVLADGGSRDGVTILSADAVNRAIEKQVDGPDAVMPLHTSIALGFFVSSPMEKLGPNGRPFGHGGMGGSMGFADPDARLGFGYVMNELHLGVWLIDPRVVKLIDAVYACL